MVTIRTVITFAINFGWILFQSGINNAFLYGDLDEDVYMYLPLGYYNTDDNLVCKLLKCVYGLK